MNDLNHERNARTNRPDSVTVPSGANQMMTPEELLIAENAKLTEQMVEKLEDAVRCALVLGVSYEQFIKHTHDAWQIVKHILEENA